MPSHEFVMPATDSKALLKRAGRSAAMWSIKRANYMGMVLPRLERAIRTLSDSLDKLKEPITIVVGQGERAQAVEVTDYASQAKITNAMLAAMETERALLGFPSPGKRRDEATNEKRANAVPSVQDVTSESAPIEPRQS